MKKTKVEPCVGDFIITNNNFHRNGRALSNLDGVIVKKENGKYGVRFGIGHKWATDLDGLLSNKFGSELTEDEFELNQE